MQYVKLVNRTSKTLHGLWDGHHYDLAPGEHAFPEIQALKFKEQNPIMGTQDPYTLHMDYLIGIVEYGDDVSPIEQSKKDELANRSMYPKRDQDVDLIQNSGYYSPHRDASPPLPLDIGFTKP